MKTEAPETFQGNKHAFYEISMLFSPTISMLFLEISMLFPPSEISMLFHEISMLFPKTEGAHHV